MAGKMIVVQDQMAPFTGCTSTEGEEVEVLVFLPKGTPLVIENDVTGTIVAAPVNKDVYLVNARRSRMMKDSDPVSVTMSAFGFQGNDVYSPEDLGLAK